MKIIKYFFEYLFIQTLLILFKIIGYENASNFGEIVGKTLGPLFRKTERILKNIERANITLSINDKKLIIKNMWGNYGRILSEYPYMKKFKSNDFNKYIQIEGKEYLEEIKKNKKRVVFVSGHFNNFELMAMQIENAGIELAAIYRPLNNIFLNKIMEKIRINYICKNQIPKGKIGSRKLLEYFKNGNSIALMIDQRVSEGIKVDFFGKLAATTSIPAQLTKKYICKNQIKKGISGIRESAEYIKNNYSIALMIDQRVSEGKKIPFFQQDALTTTLPAQLALKHKCDIVPIHLARNEDDVFEMEIYHPIKNENKERSEKNKIDLSINLNKIIEKMILKDPGQWIWTHNRWK